MRTCAVEDLSTYCDCSVLRISLCASATEHIEKQYADSLEDILWVDANMHAHHFSPSVADVEFRSRSFVHLAKGADAVVRAVERRAAELAGLPVTHAEPLQIVTEECAP